jgi:hypothetical protein
MNVIIANKYRDMLMTLDIEVIKSLEGVYDVNEVIDNFSNFYFDRMILDITALKDYNNIDTLQKLSIHLDMAKIILLLDDSDESSTSQYLSKLISMGIYNFTRNLEGVRYLLQNPNSYRDVAHIHNINVGEDGYYDESLSNSTRVIGVKNLINGAGATTLVYMMMKHLASNYSVCALEVDKRDFLYFDDKEMMSTNSADLPKELMKRRAYNVVLIDLNEYSDPDICNDVIYLIEPSILKLNKLMKRDRRVFEKHANDKIVLNMSNISSSDLNVFEYEAKAKIFYNLPFLDERNENNREINGLLSKLGFAKLSSSADDDDSSKNKLLGMFKF